MDLIQKDARLRTRRASFLLKFLRLIGRKIGRERLRELVGAGGVLAAADPLQKGYDFVGRLAFHEPCDALQVAAASADELHVMDLVLGIDIENDLFGACPSGPISNHIFPPWI